MSADAHHITAPPETATARARSMLQRAAQRAACNADEIDYINAHGTSTPLGDIAECIAVKRAFGEHAKKLAVSSTKSMTGHLLGAAGGIEAVFTVLAMRDQVAPPTINLVQPDPAVRPRLRAAGRAQDDDPRRDVQFVRLRRHQRDARVSRAVGGPRMALIVQKYGGTSVGSRRAHPNVARRVARFHREGHQLVVVVSAMSGETNRLLGLAKELSARPDPRELDVVAATGEQVTVGLLAIALQERGLARRKSYTGGQVRIAHRQRVHQGAHPRRSTRRGCAPTSTAARSSSSPGFQGVDADGNITTLGRGGSDTSAVALAAALKADECQIYTDVDGVYTTDPRIVPEARRLDPITFEEMLEMASLGSKVLQIRSVEFAGKYRVPLRVLSSFDDPEIDRRRAR